MTTISRVIDFLVHVFDLLLRYGTITSELIFAYIFNLVGILVIPYVYERKMVLKAYTFHLNILNF